MIDEYINRITQNTVFLKLKDVIENNGYHDHEAVYDHLIKTKDIAKREISADFITNPEAKKLSLEFVNENFHGMRRADIIILIALVHDVGKILHVREGKSVRSIVVTDSSGITSIPGHEYWGSTIVAEVLKDLNLDFEVITYIGNVIRLHATFSETYFEVRKDWPMESLLNDAKSQGEGFYKEAMFNQYCDCFTAKPFEYGKSMLIKLFNEPGLYIKGAYVLP